MAYNGHTTLPGLTIGPYSTSIGKIKRYKASLVADVGTVNANTIKDVTVTNTDIKAGDEIWSVMFTAAPTANIGIGGWWVNSAGGSWTLRVFNSTGGAAVAASFSIQYLTLNTSSDYGYTQTPAIRIGPRGTPIARLNLQSGTISCVAGANSYVGVTKVLTGVDANDVFLGAWCNNVGLPSGLCVGMGLYNDIVNTGSAALQLYTPTTSASAGGTRTFFFLTASPAA